MTFQHRIRVSLRGGRQVVTIYGQNSLFTWTRQDGGLTVRADGLTHRFSKRQTPQVVKAKTRR